MKVSELRDRAKAWHTKWTETNRGYKNWPAIEEIYTAGFRAALEHVLQQYGSWRFKDRVCADYIKTICVIGEEE